MKVLVISGILFLFVSCENRDYFLVEVEKIDSDEIAHIDFYTCEDGVRWQDTQPISSIRDWKSIKEVVYAINYSNDPTVGKGSCWNKICLVKWDTMIVLHTNGEIVGKGNIGRYYSIQDPEIIQKYFK